MSNNEYIKPPLIFIIFYFCCFVYGNYIIFQLWFTPKKILKRNRKKIYKIPRWYPLRGFAIDMVNDDKFWINSNRVMSIFAEIFLVGTLTLVLIAWFKGK